MVRTPSRGRCCGWPWLAGAIGLWPWLRKKSYRGKFLRLGDYLKGDYLGSGSILPVANATGAWAYYGSPWPRKKSFRGRAPLTQSKMIIYGQGVIYEWPLEGDGILRVANAGAIFKGQRGISRVVMTSLHGGGIRGGDGTIRSVMIPP